MAIKTKKTGSSLIIDPYAERESLRYDKPVPSREIIIQILKNRGKPAKQLDLQKILHIQEDQIEAFSRRLTAMRRDGQLMITRKKEYGLVSKMHLISGRVVGHRDGYGFVVTDDVSDDLFLPAKYMRTVFDGDRVLVRVANIDRRGRREATLVQVIECNTLKVVGRFKTESGMQFVVPDNKRISHEILIPPGKEGNAKEGQIVTAWIMTQPTYRKQPIGQITEIVGDQRAPGMEVDIAVRSHGLPYEFSPEIIASVSQLQEPNPKTSYPDRQDIRHLPLITIDGEEAKDFDDAVYCTKMADHTWRLLVAIADVSFYVKPETLIDNEAFNRGNSVYFPDRVIPMLPEILSNDLCSLNPSVDRFCMVCDMQLNQQAEIITYRFYPAVMHSRARLTYTQVSDALQGNKTIQKSLGDLYLDIKNLHQLYQQLYANRQKRGALDFDTIETKIIFDQQKKISAIVPVVRNDAHKMIEEAMLCANTSAAAFLIQHNIPALFRVHLGPTPEKLKDLSDFLKEFHLALRGGKHPTPKHYAVLLKNIAKRPDASLIQTVLLRSLRQAVYHPDNQGHFGLAYDCYTHFTSPIRRYPDLLVHRQIREILTQNNHPQDFSAELKQKLYQIGEHCSFTERRADEATRSAIMALKCEFMAERVGTLFDGLITAVTGFGLFVELTGIFIEGLIHISTLPDDYYYFDPVKHRLTGEHAGLTFNLGDRIAVKVVRVDIDEKKIDLILAESIIIKHQKHEKTKSKSSSKKRSH